LIHKENIMKITDLSPLVTPFAKGKTRKASSWTIVDSVDDMGAVRALFHYTTLMAEYVHNDDDGSWWLGVVSVGHGSVSDQKEMNQLLAQHGSDLRFKRDGGNPRYVNTITGATVSTR
jgi:hypothetical protein